MQCWLKSKSTRNFIVIGADSNSDTNVKNDSKNKWSGTQAKLSLVTSLNKIGSDGGSNTYYGAIDDGISNVVSVLWSISSEPFDINDGHWDLKGK